MSFQAEIAVVVITAEKAVTPAEHLPTIKTCPGRVGIPAQLPIACARAGFGNFMLTTLLGWCCRHWLISFHKNLLFVTGFQAEHQQCRDDRGKIMPMHHKFEEAKQCRYLNPDESD
jgi:hypothetical protein